MPYRHFNSALTGYGYLGLMIEHRGNWRGLLAVVAGVAALVAALTTGGAAGKPARPEILAERTVDGIRLIALAPENDRPFEVSILPPGDGLARMEAALRLIGRRSPGNATVIRRLQAAGRVSLIYYPNNFHDENRLNTQTVALFLPDFLKRRELGAEGREFVVVINQFGVKWAAPELAAIIVHELAGHGLQHLENRIAGARPLDLECEASLYQEQAYQDLGVAKKSRTVVLFRRQMEYRYCADFRGYMRERIPGRLALWDALNPDVPALLEIFHGYRGTQSAAAKHAGKSPSSRSR